MCFIDPKDTQDKPRLSTPAAFSCSIEQFFFIKIEPLLDCCRWSSHVSADFWPLNTLNITAGVSIVGFALLTLRSGIAAFMIKFGC